MAELLCGIRDRPMRLLSVWTPSKQQHINGSEQHSHKKTVKQMQNVGHSIKLGKYTAAPDKINSLLLAFSFFLSSFVSFFPRIDFCKAPDLELHTRLRRLC